MPTLTNLGRTNKNIDADEIQKRDFSTEDRTALEQVVHAFNQSTSYDGLPSEIDYTGTEKWMYNIALSNPTLTWNILNAYMKIHLLSLNGDRKPWKHSLISLFNQIREKGHHVVYERLRIPVSVPEKESLQTGFRTRSNFLRLEAQYRESTNKKIQTNVTLLDALSEKPDMKVYSLASDPDYAYRAYQILTNPSMKYYAVAKLKDIADGVPGTKIQRESSILNQCFSALEEKGCFSDKAIHAVFEHPEWAWQKIGNCNWNQTSGQDLTRLLTEY